MSFHVYLIHNLLNNKVYIGRSVNVANRWIKHIRTASGNVDKDKYPIHRAITKYGVENFTFCILQELFDNLECNQAEKYWISYFKTRDPNFGYNLTDGGEGVSGRIVSEATRQKIREKHIGMQHTEEAKIKMRGENNHRSKLTLDGVKEIRHRFNDLGHNLVSLSKDYDVSSRTIARVIYNIDWHDKNYTSPIPRKINNSGKPKLTLEKANEIRQLHLSGVSLLELSKLFGVTKENISAIIKGKIWRINE